MTQTVSNRLKVSWEKMIRTTQSVFLRSGSRAQRD